MKGIVLEIRNGTAAVLREDGEIVKTRQKCAVGDTIELPAEKIRFPSARSVRSIAAAAAAVIVIGGGSGIYTYENVMACSYVSLDVNPSLELVLNRQNRVIRVNACDDEAESVVEAIKEQNIKNMKVDDALETAYDVLKENGYIAEDNVNYILFNVSSDESSRKEILTEKIETLIGEKEETLAITTKSSLDDREKARELGISAGKYHEIRMIEEKENPDSVNMDAQTVGRYSGMSVRECMEEAGQIPKPDTQGGPSPAGASEPEEGGSKSAGAAQRPAPGDPNSAAAAQQPEGGAQENVNPPQQTENIQQTPAEAQPAEQPTSGAQGSGSASGADTNMQTGPDNKGTGHENGMNNGALQSAAPAQSGPAAQQGTGTAPGNPGADSAGSPQQQGGPGRP